MITLQLIIYYLLFLSYSLASSSGPTDEDGKENLVGTVVRWNYFGLVTDFYFTHINGNTGFVDPGASSLNKDVLNYTVGSYITYRTNIAWTNNTVLLDTWDELRHLYYVAILDMQGLYELYEVNATGASREVFPGRLKKVVSIEFWRGEIVVLIRGDEKIEIVSLDTDTFTVTPVFTTKRYHDIYNPNSAPFDAENGRWYQYGQTWDGKNCFWVFDIARKTVEELALPVDLEFLVASVYSPIHREIYGVTRSGVLVSISTINGDYRRVFKTDLNFSMLYFPLPITFWSRSHLMYLIAGGYLFEFNLAHDKLVSKVPLTGMSSSDVIFNVYHDTDNHIDALTIHSPSYSTPLYIPEHKDKIAAEVASKVGITIGMVSGAIVVMITVIGIFLFVKRRRQQNGYESI